MKGTEFRRSKRSRTEFGNEGKAIKGSWIDFLPMVRTILCVLVVQCALMNAALAKDAEKEPSKITTTHNNVILEASVSEKAEAGSTAHVTVTLTNKSGKAIHIAYIDGVRELNLALSAHDGSDIPKTELGESRTGTLVKGKSNIKPIAPGETNTWRLNLHELYHLTKGTYDLSLSVEIDPAGDSYSLGIEKLLLSID